MWRCWFSSLQFHTSSWRLQRKLAITARWSQRHHIICKKPNWSVWCHLAFFCGYRLSLYTFLMPFRLFLSYFCLFSVSVALNLLIPSRFQCELLLLLCSNVVHLCSHVVFLLTPLASTKTVHKKTTCSLKCIIINNYFELKKKRSTDKTNKKQKQPNKNIQTKNSTVV